MQRNIHTPERLSGESVLMYEDRRNQSAKANALNAHAHCGTQTSREQLRAAQRKSGAMSKVAGSYGRGLRNWINQKQAAVMANKRAAVPA